MLTIKGTDFRLDTIPLKTVRPFEWDTVSLSKTGIDPLDNSRIQSYLEQKVKKNNFFYKNNLRNYSCV